MPFARSADDHQRKNAQALQAAGAALMVEEEGPDRRVAGRRAPRAAGRDPARIEAMEDAARRLGRPDAAARVADLLRRPGAACLGRSSTSTSSGIGGSGMSGIAEVLLNLGYTVSGSDLKRSRGHRPAGLARGARSRRGTAADHLQGAHVVVTSTAVKARQPRGAGGAPARHPGDPARGDAGRADAPQVRGGGGGQPRQDHHHLHGRPRARQGRARSHRGGRAAAWASWARARAWARATSWWRRRTSPTARS